MKSDSSGYTWSLALPLLSEVVSDIGLVSATIGKDPADMSVTDYNRGGGKFDGRSLRKLGGFAVIVKNAFPPNKMNYDFVTRRYVQKNASYVSKLERAVADKEIFKQSLLDGFESALSKMGTIQVSKIDKPTLKSSRKKARANGVMISDTHFGLKIKSDEVEHNEYDWLIAARRMGKLADQAAQYKINHRDECDEIHVCLGGDLGQGIIHMSDNNTDLITYQVAGIISYIVQTIDHLRKYYQHVHIHCTHDNHLRLTHKGPDRALAQKFDAFSTMIHIGIQYAFRGMDDVTFTVPKHAITTFNIFDHKFGLTHGDTHIESGNTGTTVNIKNIANQVLRLNAAAADNKIYDVILLGHVHTPLYTHLSETNTRLVINGTGSGTDPYSESKGWFRTAPVQVIWETVKEHAIGDLRFINLQDADRANKYLEIIKPYDYKIKI